MPGKLSNKIAIVTGSTSGIGEEIARTFAREGASVIVSGRRTERGEAIVQSIRDNGGMAVFQQGDLTTPEDCKALVRRAQDEFGGLDILVNNAAVFPRVEFDNITVEEWDREFNLNFRAAFLCSQAAIPLMNVRGGGSIINMGSCHTFSGASEKLFTYSCTKGALYMMTMKMALAMARQRIRVNWITVGWVLTEKEYEVEAGQGLNAQELEERGRRVIPMGEFNTEAEMAAGCLYFASDDAIHVTGSELNISSGLCVHF